MSGSGDPSQRRVVQARFGLGGGRKKVAARPRRCSRLLLMAAGVSWQSLTANPARAENEPLPVALEYGATEECANPELFWSALANRAPWLQPAGPGESEVTLIVVVQSTPSGAQGSLQIRTEEDLTSPRYVVAEDCRGVVDALALTASVSLEAAEAPEPQPANVPLAPSATSEPEPPPPPADPFDYETTTLPIPDLTEPSHWHPKLHAALAGAKVVDVGYNVGPLVGLSLERVAVGAWTPSIQISGAYLRSDWLEPHARAEFVLTTALTNVCPLRLGTGDFTFRPCLMLQGGVLEASGHNISNPEGSIRGWGAFGLTAQGELVLSDSWRLLAELTGEFPLTPQTFTMGQPERQIAATAGFVPWMSIGVAYAPRSPEPDEDRQDARWGQTSASR